MIIPTASITGCPHRFDKKFPGHFRDKMKKIPGQNNKTVSSLNIPGQHMSSQ